MARLFSVDGAYPAGIGKKIEDHAWINDGTLALFDFSVEDCLNPAAQNPDGAFNLADAKMKALTGASTSLVFRRSNSLPHFSRTDGLGIMKVDSGSNQALQIASASSTTIRPPEFDAYMHGGGVSANQPDPVLIVWMRDLGNFGTTSYDLTYLAELDENPAWAQMDILNGATRLETLPVSLGSGREKLNQIAFSRDAVFLNGRQIGAGPPTRLLNTLNAMTPGNVVQWRFMQGGPALTDLFVLYRVGLEDLKVSGRPAIESVREDYDYVTSYAPFRDTV